MDIGDAKPPGCKGKIDFLFVISRAWTMKGSQEKLITAFPAFIETIKSKFADFDFHIMVIDGDHEWGLEPCDADCEKQGSCAVPGYPCDLLDLVTICLYHRPVYPFEKDNPMHLEVGYKLLK